MHKYWTWGRAGKSPFAPWSKKKNESMRYKELWKTSCRGKLFWQYFEDIYLGNMMLKHIKSHVENRNLFLNVIIFTNAFTNQERFSNANYDQRYLKKKKKKLQNYVANFLHLMHQRMGLHAVNMKQSIWMTFLHSTSLYSNLIL